LRAYLTALEDDVETPELELALIETADAIVFVNGEDNAMELSDVAPEKMGDTVHPAIGSAIPNCVPEDTEGNESAVHVDMSTDSVIEVDGDVVQHDGTFVFEDGFVESATLSA